MALPVVNRRATLLGVIITVSLLSAAMLAMRLYTRFKIAKAAGWDDLFVVLAFLFILANSICNCLAVDIGGEGRHVATLSKGVIQNALLFYYLGLATYVTSGIFIKLSLLLQYLRIFNTGKTLIVCRILVLITAIWGTANIFMTWFPCFPVRGYWHWEINSKCYGFGLNPKNIENGEFNRALIAHAVLNTILDTCILLVPLKLYRQPNLRRKEVFALTGLFLIGATVVFIAIWRLYLTVSTTGTVDLTWVGPKNMLIAILECNFAVMAACMPVFWPHMQKSLGQIFVTREVRISEHRRLQEYELEGGESRIGSEHAISIKSRGSQDALTSEPEKVVDAETVKRHYKDQYVIEQVNPLAEVSMRNTECEPGVQRERKNSMWRS